MADASPATASEWIVRLSQGALSVCERHALARWIAEDPQRLKDLNDTKSVWDLAGKAATASLGADALNTAIREYEISRARSRTARRIAVGGSFALAASLALALTTTLDMSRAPQLASHSNVRTPIGQVERYYLPDKSSVTIAADSAVVVDFTPSARRIAIDRGEVFLRVARDERRPFTVTAGAHSVTVTGTKFNVDYDAMHNEIEVAVVEGSVRVGLPPQISGPIENLKAGDVVFFKANGDVVRRKISPSQASAWQDGSLYFDQTPVREALLNMNRYASKPVVAMDEKITNLTLSGRFETRDPAAFIYALQEIFGVTAHETDNAWELTLNN